MGEAISKPAGVMDVAYATERKNQLPLRCRLKWRAFVAAQAIRRYCQVSSPRVLDIGAAEGQTMVEIAKLIGAGEYLGIEFDDSLRNAHPPLPPNVGLIAGDATCLPDSLEDGSFDAVTLLPCLSTCRPRRRY